MLTVETLMSQVELPFSSSDLLHVYTVMHPKTELGTPFFKVNNYLCLKNPHHPQTKLVTDNENKDLFLNKFVWVYGK